LLKALVHIPSGRTQLTAPEQQCLCGAGFRLIPPDGVLHGEVP